MHWEGYNDHFKTMMQGMLVSKENSDITFVCDDFQTIKAHKNILSASSPAFQKMFGFFQGNVMFLYMRGIKHQIMESILEFIYLGEVHFKEDWVEEFIAIARSLEIIGLNETSQYSDEFDEIVENVSCKSEPTEINDYTHIGDVTLNEVNANRTELKLEEAKQRNSSKMRRKIYEVPLQSQTNKASECKSCGKVLADTKSLIRHKKSIHDGVKYPCKYCDYQATIRQNLDRHVAAKHTSTSE